MLNLQSTTLIHKLLSTHLHPIKSALSVISNDLSYFGSTLGQAEIARPLAKCRQVADELTELLKLFRFSEPVDCRITELSALITSKVLILRGPALVSCCKEQLIAAANKIADPDNLDPWVSLVLSLHGKLFQENGLLVLHFYDPISKTTVS